MSELQGNDVQGWKVYYDPPRRLWFVARSKPEAAEYAAQEPEFEGVLHELDGGTLDRLRYTYSADDCVGEYAHLLGKVVSFRERLEELVVGSLAIGTMCPHLFAWVEDAV